MRSEKDGGLDHQPPTTILTLQRPNRGNLVQDNLGPRGSDVRGTVYHFETKTPLAIRQEAHSRVIDVCMHFRAVGYTGPGGKAR